MIYFDNSATGGRKPDCVLTAVSSAIRVCANPGRSGHKLSLACATQIERARHDLNRFFHGFGYERVVFTKNCTEALNLAILGTLKKGDHALASCMEHNSILRPLEFLRKSGEITYDICPLSQDGTITVAEILKRIKPNTKLLILTTASNVTGAIPPFDKIKKNLPKGVLLLCDGAQGGGHLPIDMQAFGIDFLTIAGHKGMLGIQGSGALLFSENYDPAPLLFGGTGSMSLSLDMPDFYPDCLEAGTLSYPAVLSLAEGTRYLTLHQTEIAEKLLSLTKYCIDKISALEKYQIFSIPNPCGIVAFRHEDLQSEFLADALSEKYDIAVRGGLHCAPLIHKALGSLDGGLVRVSFSHYNSCKEIDELFFALQALS